MSPERKAKSKYYLPGRLRPLSERTYQQRERIDMYALPTRAGILEKVDLATRTKPELNGLIQDEDYRPILLEFIDARIAAANGDRTLINNFIDRQNPRSENYDPQLATIADSLNTHFHIVLDCFPKKRK